MKLTTLINPFIQSAIICGDPSKVEISDICLDSRKASAGSLFIALTGSLADGHDFIDKALDNGASAIIHQKPIARLRPGIVYIQVPEAHSLLSTIADRFFESPSSRLHLVGITGTNGKTTTVTLLFRLFRGLGYSCGLLSTIANYIDDKEYPTKNTTPDIIEINRLLSQMCKHGCQYCFMEVSSHAVDQGRIEGLHFRGGIFSNLTHDHLDYHKTFANYLAAKKRFFDTLPSSAFALTNVDDKNGMVMVQNTSAQISTYSCRSMADYCCRILEDSIDGMHLIMDGADIWTLFLGRHNAYNLLAVYSTARLLGADKDETLEILSNMTAVPGRLEYVKGGKNITAVVDYAHTPDALENVLSTLLECRLNNQKLICVVGCGGDRDKTKRPEMAAIAVKYADLSIFTSDNPRSEDPQQIIADMLQGMPVAMAEKYLCISNRAEAITAAVRMASEGSIILVAGKGHENYQEINGVRNHFDDKEILNQLLCSTK